MTLNTLKDLLTEQLNELYAGEKHALQVLPKLVRAATNRKLSDTLQSQEKETREQASRLEAIFRMLDIEPRRVETKGMKGLLEDCIRLATAARAEPHVRDAALIAVAQHVKHDEIAGYGCARTWANLLGFRDAAAQLQTTLEEERRADRDLTRVAEGLNQEALAPAAV